ncbi:hypothetical protein AMJ86_04795, partial [bacterium SM23_57]
NRALAKRVLTIPPSLESLDELPTPPLGFLIICNSIYESNTDLLEYVDWKSRKGYQVTVASTDETGTTREQIKQYIQNAYDLWDVPPTHVLFIGDTGDIPYYTGSTSSNPSTDLYFACLEGGDYFADVGLGRLSVITPDQLGNIIQKILSFERVEWTGNDDWETHASFMASTDNWQVSEGTHNYVISNYLQPAGYTCDRFYTHTYNANIGQVIEAINAGRSLLVYSGHGYEYGWADGPAMNQTQVRELYNEVYPFVCSFSCLTGRFQVDECFGETWIRDPEAAVSFWGSSVTSYWGEDDILERRLFEGFFDNQFPGDDVNFTWVSGMTNYAKTRLYQYYGSTGTVLRYFEMYNILGDPSVDIWTSVPRIVSVNHPTAILVGQDEVNVEVSVAGMPIANAMVCLMNNQVWGTGYTNDNGVATIEFEDPPQIPSIIDVYVTGHDLHPAESSIQVITPSGPFVAYSSHQINDPTGNNNGQLDYGESVTLDLTVQNVGIAAATNVNITLRCDNEYVTIVDSTETYGSIAVGQEVTVQDAFAFDMSVDVPDNHRIVLTVVAMSDQDTSETNFDIFAYAPLIACTSIEVDDAAGNNNGILDPGETADLDITIINNGGVASAAMTAELTTLEALVTIISGSGNYAALDPDQEATESFTVSVSSVCPLGYQAGLILAVNEPSTGRDAVDRFNVEIGDVVQLPTGPDQYGYMAYDHGEAAGAPNYSWVEINQQLGGPGTFAEITNDDQTRQFTLPFNFQYYNDVYATISVCSNGWIAMGWTGNTAFSNSGIPSDDGPARMIAACWDDLNPQEGGSIWVWADSAGGRYIVEYYRVPCYEPPHYWNTFQVILYDPAVYPTGSGDGMILLQYQGVNDMTSCTVGIENANETIGIQYLFDGNYDSHALEISAETAIMFTTGETQTPGTVIGTAALLGGTGSVQDVEISIGSVTANPSSNGSYTLSNVSPGFQTLIASLYGYGTITLPNLAVPSGSTLSGVDLNLPYLEPPSDLVGAVEEYVVILQWQETGYLGTDHAGMPGESRMVGVFSSGSNATRQHASTGLDESLEFLGYRIYRDGVCIDSRIENTEYWDVPPQNGTYDYYVTAEFNLGESDSSNHVSVFYEASSVPTSESVLIPEEFALHQNYPNPFNPETTIPFDLPQAGRVTLQVFNIIGQQVAVVVDRPLPARFHHVSWNGSGLSSGVYFYRILVRQNGVTVFQEFQKAVMLR